MVKRAKQRGPSPPTHHLYHRTSRANAAEILRSGFRDGVGEYLTSREFRGVWLSNSPLDANEGAHGDTVLEIDLRMEESKLADYEWIEEGKHFREWLIPTRKINGRATIRIIEED